MTKLHPSEQLPAVPRDERVRSVLVVGGGSAGWMAATALATALSRDIELRLVESDAIGAVGVGEATIPPIRQFNAFLGLDERQFILDTHGTFKLGVRFRGWSRPGDDYLHQFGPVGREIDTLVKLHHWWLAGRLAGGEDYPEFQDLYVARWLAEGDRFGPPERDPQRPLGRFTYAYQFDAHLYGAHLRKIAEERGAQRLEGRITGVERDGESGHVRAVVLEDGRRLEADLFIDCSGFRSLLLGTELGEPFDDWSHWIPSDRALAVPSERNPDAGVTPYTLSSAHQVGWQWRIPLQHRTGNGHVYASAFSSDEEAEARLMGNLDAAALGEPRLIRFRTGRRRRHWVGNVVAIGLSSGFLEPIESTSIHFVQAALEHLLDLFPTRAMEPVLRDRFNEISRIEWARVRDFIIAHYHLTERDDSEFWRYTRNMSIPDTLAEVLELWRARGILAIDGGHLFQTGSWSSVLLGQRCMPRGVHALADRTSPEHAAQLVRQIAGEVRQAAQLVPAHSEFLARNFAAPA